LLVPVPASRPSHTSVDLDGVNEYARRVLEIGFLYKSLQLNVQIPNRDRFLALMKCLMRILKSNNNKSKYSLEILRFLCHQMATFSEKTAQETFYGLFVNTKGKVDTSIGADLQMKHVVRLVKGHLRSVASNKIFTESMDWDHILKNCYTGPRKCHDRDPRSLVKGQRHYTHCCF
jgi:hypothetical protein